MTVDQNNLIQTVSIQGFDDVVGQFRQYFGSDGDGSGKHHMMRAPAEPNGRSQDCTGFLSSFFSYCHGNIGVCAQREVVTVLFDTSDRDNCYAF